MTDSALFRDSATGDLRDASGPVTISGSGAVDSVFGRTGVVVAAPGDYTASDVGADASGAAAAAQAASQPLDSDLTAIAALDASTAGAIASDGAGWIKKTYAQFKTALSLVKGDVGLGNVDNTADAAKSVATAAALTTARTIDGQSFDGSGNITVIAPGTHAATGKTTPVDADELALVDSAASNVLKKLTWANVKATLKTYFDTLYMAAGASATPSGAAGGDLNGTYPNPLVDVGLFGGVPWTTVVKTLDTGRASTTSPTADPELAFTAASGTFYEIELFVIYVSTAGAGTPDLKAGVGEDATTTRGFATYAGYGATDTPTATTTGGTGTGVVANWGTAAAVRALMIRGSHLGAGGTFALYWSQVTSGTNATTVKAGSILRYRAIA